MKGQPQIIKVVFDNDVETTGDGKIQTIHMRIKFWHLACLGLVIISIFISSCAMPRTYGRPFHSSIKPIYPEMNPGFVSRYRTITNLSPELKWKDIRKDLKKDSLTFDVCIFETPYRSTEDINKKNSQFQSSWGIPVYSTNNLATNFHQVAIKLKPDTYYNWSVRVRDGENVREWSYFNQEVVVMAVQTVYENIPFGFKTPPQ